MRRTGIVALAFVCTACAERGSDGFLVRDSAGIAIAESHAPAWHEGQSWRVAAEPLLRVGTVDGPAEYQLHDVQGAVRLGDGTLAVANAGSSEIRFYDRRGRFIDATGGSGDGPGEYRLIAALGQGPRDSLWVYDYGSRRFTVLTEKGSFARLVTLDATLSAPNAVGRLSDGSFIVAEQWSARLGTERRLGLTRGLTAITRISADGAQSDTVTTVLGREVFLGEEGGRTVMSTPLFAHASSAAASGGFTFVGDQTRFEILQYAASGNLKRIIRVPSVDLAVTRVDIDRATEQALASVPEARRPRLRAQLAAMDVPPSRPAFGRLEVDAAGNLWAAEPTRYPNPARSWMVFDPAGRMLGVVVLPDRFRLLQIGPDWVLGVWRNELDVECVAVHSLEKDQRSGGSDE